MAKKVLVTILGIIILVALVVWVVKKQKPASHSVTQKTTQPSPTPRPSVQRTDIDQSKLPPNFPADLPLEKGAKITQNFTAVMPGANPFSDRAFITSKTLDANFKIYTDYFTKNGWSTIPPLNQTNLKIIQASKNGQTVQVTMSEDATKVNTVEIVVGTSAK